MSKLIMLSKLKTALTPLIALINKKAERPNWNENNYDSVSYIENRPFYTDEQEVAFISGTYTTIDTGNGCAIEFKPKKALIKDNVYQVSFNGESYSCVCWVPFGETGAIGNGSLFGLENSTEDPFLIMTMPDGSNALLATSSAGTFDISVIGIQEKIVKIPEKYLPEISSVGKESSGYNAEIFNDYENNFASGDYSHAEGFMTIAAGYGSHAEGGETYARESYTHAEGYGTVTNAEMQHVQGKWNDTDYLPNYAHVVGNGDSSSSRSNAHTINWDGTGWFAGDVYVGGTSQFAGGAKKLATEESITSIVTNQIEPLENSINTLNTSINTLNTNVSSHETRISNIETYISSPRKGIPMLDEINGYTYILTMRDGELVTYIGTDHIEVTQMPNKTTYVEGEYLDTDGMVVMAYGQDGSSKEVTSVVELSSVSSDGDVEITYTECGYVFTTIINTEASPFDPVTTLIDFEYTDNGDGTYTITGWKGTTNGAASTEIIIPNNSKIIV